MEVRLSMYDFRCALATNRLNFGQYAGDEADIPEHNQPFAKDPTSVHNIFVPLLDADLNFILCEKFEHRIANDHLLSSKRGGYELRILSDDYRASYAKAKVEVYKHVDHAITVKYKERSLRYERIN